MPIRKWRWGKGKPRQHDVASSHLIMSGFKSKKGSRDIPTILRGLVLCRKTYTSEDRRLVDYAAMDQLGFSKSQVDEAIKLHRKAPDGLLPTAIHVRLCFDARYNDRGYWDTVGTFDAQYSKWDTDGLFCSGDGESAMRRMDDGTRKKIECIPVGTPGYEPQEWCPFSVNKECKIKGALVVQPGFIADGDGPEYARFRPLRGVSRAVAKPGGDTQNRRVTAEIEGVCDMLNGRIAGLVGVLTIEPEKAKAPGLSGHQLIPRMQLILDAQHIEDRSRKLLGYSQAAHSDVAALPAPEQDEAVDPPAPSDDELSTDEQPVEAEFVEEEEPARSDDEQRDFDRLMELAENLAEEKESWFMGPREVVEAASEFKKNHRIHQPEDFFRHEGKDAGKHAIAMKWMRKTIVRLESGEWSPPDGWESAYTGGDA